MGELVARIVDACRRHALVVVLAYLVLAIIAGYYAATHLSLDTDLSKLKGESDALLTGLKGKTLSPAQQSTIDKAKQFYDWYDYLDSYRLLKSIGA